MSYVLKMYIMICATHYMYAKADEDVDWCGLQCGKRRSTMCEFDHQTFADDCGDFKHVMTPKMRKHLLHQHNDYRNKMAEGRKNRSWPKSSNMRQLGWDVRLEAVAMRWAEQCVDDNDNCPITPDFWYVGQNVAIFSNTGEAPDLNGSQAFLAWSKEMQNVDVKPTVLLENFDGSFNYGHFTQIVWAETHKLGCAEITFKRSGWYNTHIFCNYGLGGNFIGDKIYRIGAPCSECPKGTECKIDSRYSSLCALPDDAKQPKDIEGPSKRLIESGTDTGADDASKPKISTTLSFIVLLKMRFRYP